MGEDFGAVFCHHSEWSSIIVFTLRLLIQGFLLSSHIYSYCVPSDSPCSDTDSVFLNRRISGTEVDPLELPFVSQGSRPLGYPSFERNRGGDRGLRLLGIEKS